MKTTFCSLLVAIFFVPLFVSASAITIGETNKNQTSDILKKRRSQLEVTATHIVDAVLGCKRLGIVKSRRRVELWERSRSCEILTEDLKREVSSLKGDVLLIQVTGPSCKAENLTGEAYLCAGNDS